MQNNDNSTFSMDALLPAEMAQKAQKIGDALLVGLVHWFIYLRLNWTGH